MDRKRGIELGWMREEPQGKGEEEEGGNGEGFRKALVDDDGYCRL